MEGLKGLPLRLPSVTHGTRHVFHLFVIQLEAQALRDKLIKYLAEKEIISLIHYPIAIHLQPAYRYLNYKEGSLPRTEKAVKTIMSLPIFPEMEDEELEYVIENIRNFFKNK